jgi:hypothetical protein
LLLLAPVVLGLLGGAGAHVVERSSPSPGDAAVAWKPGRLDESVSKKSGDIDAMLALEPPSRLASTEAWIEFARSLAKGITSGDYPQYGYHTSLIGWWVYVAEHRPDAIYVLHDQSVVDDERLTHLIEYGLVPDWAERVAGADRLILTDGTALLDFGVTHGIEAARRRFIDAFFSHRVEQGHRGNPLRLSLENLRFALSGMSDSEIAEVVPRLTSGLFELDPRNVTRLLLDERLAGREQELLALIREHAYTERSMSSYLTDGALLGHGDYVRELLRDVADNAKQPTNFYCSACGLALTSDGLLGSGLLDVLQSGRAIAIQQEGREFILRAASGTPR